MTTPSNANMSGLAPCPFCGGAPFDCGFRRWECGSCGAQGPAGSKADATNGWNRRVTAASAQARIAELEADVYAAHVAGRFWINAAKARADRLAKALEAVRSQADNCAFNIHQQRVNLETADLVRTFEAIEKTARTALQQETQP